MSNTTIKFLDIATEQGPNIPFRAVDINGDGTEYALATSAIGGSSGTPVEPTPSTAPTAQSATLSYSPSGTPLILGGAVMSFASALGSNKRGKLKTVRLAIPGALSADFKLALWASDPTTPLSISTSSDRTVFGAHQSNSYDHLVTLYGLSAQQATPTSVNHVTAVAVNAGGSGYAVNDVITATGGTKQAAATFRVLTVSAGVVTSVMLLDPGYYTANPTTTGCATTSSSAGTGLTLNLTMGAQSTTFYEAAVSADLEFTNSDGNLYALLLVSSAATLVGGGGINLQLGMEQA